VFGNSLRGREQVENLLFAKLIAMNSINFDYGECGFAEGNMTIKDKRDGLSREGSGRVAIYKETGLINCYTLECNYHGSKRINYIPQRIDTRTQKVAAETPITDARSKLYEGKAVFSLEHLADIGRFVGIALLDYFELNPISRVPMSTYKSVENMRKEIGSSRKLIKPPRSTSLNEKRSNSIKRPQTKNSQKTSKNGGNVGKRIVNKIPPAVQMPKKRNYSKEQFKAVPVKTFSFNN
jgi:hypothetical protein